MQGSHIAFLSLSSFWGGVGGEFGQATPKSKLIFQHTVSAKREVLKKIGEMWLGEKDNCQKCICFRAVFSGANSKDLE